jgi:hypothetical protein
MNNPVSDSAAPRSLPKRSRRTGLTTTIAGVAAAGLIAVLAFASGSSSAAADPPTTLVNSFSGENSVTAGALNWQFITGTVTETFAATSRSVVTGSVVLGSSNTSAVSGRLGVCYKSASGVVTNVNWEVIDLTAPSGQWVTQTVSGMANPAAAGSFAVGLCAYDTSANLTYNTGFGAGAGTVTVGVNAGS